MFNRTYLTGLLVLIMGAAAFVYSQETETIKLPPPQKDSGKTLMQALSLRQTTRSFATTPLSEQELSNLLWSADGINRPDAGKRTAPSAKNWQEIDTYVFLPNGVFLYNAKEHSLKKILGDDLRALAGVQDFVKTAPLNLVYIADLSKIGNNSDEDKWTLTGADAGFIAQNVYLYCASRDLGCVVRASVDKKALAEKLKLRPTQKIVLAQTVGYKK